MHLVQLIDSVKAKSNTKLFVALLMTIFLSACGAGAELDAAVERLAANESQISDEEVAEQAPQEVLPVQITNHPESISADSGETISFTVSASGGGSLAFQWRKNNQEIAGANSNSLTLTNVSESDGALYDVVVSNSVGSQFSLAALLTVSTSVVVIEEPVTEEPVIEEPVIEEPVINPVVIIAQPQAIAIEESASASFNVEVTGDGDITYQWLKDGEVISGANSDSFTLSAVSLADAANYSVIVTNSEGPVFSDAASLTVNEAVVVASAIELTWDVPQEREDGSALALYEINGYVIAYGTSQTDLSNEILVDGASSTSTVLDNLDAGTYYFSIATVDSDGVQGAYSNVIEQSI